MEVALVASMTWLDHYANAVTAIATTVLAALTFVLWGENRKLRKAGFSPEVVAYLQPHPDGHGGIQFVLANVGRGPAFNVRFDLEYDEADFAAHNAMLGNDMQRTAISVIPQNESIKSLIGISFQLYGKVGEKDLGPLKPFKVRTTYNNIIAQTMSRERVIDIRQFSGLLGVIEKSDQRKVSQSLEAIESHLAKIARQSTRFSAYVDTTSIADPHQRSAKGEP